MGREPLQPIQDGVYPVELMGLDEANFLLALTALQMRRHGYGEEVKKQSDLAPRSGH